MALTIFLQQLQSVLPALDDQVLDSLQIVSAECLTTQYYPHLDPAQPALILGLSDQSLAGRLQAVLGQAYPAAHPAILIHGAAARQSVSLGELSQQDGFSPVTALLLPPRARAGRLCGIARHRGASAFT